jgi:hypothetical protein
MPFINKACDNCKKTENPVYERYQCVPGTTLEFKTELIGKNLYKIVPKNLEYWCTDCYRLEKFKMEIIDESEKK